MPFDYYHRLSKRQKSIYRQSDSLTEVPLPRPAELAGVLPELADVLERADRRAVQQSCQTLLNGLVTQLETPVVIARVLAARPSKSWGELHGLYEAAEDGEAARVTVWMRTAQRRQVVAFRSFLRTVLHELCHHLDYEHFHLADSFHTEGFFKRESSLFRQLDAAQK